MKYLKSYKIFEELSPDTYEEAANRLDDLGYYERANDIRYHAISSKYDDVDEMLDYIKEYISDLELKGSTLYDSDDEMMIELDYNYLYLKEKEFCDGIDEYNVYDQDDLYIIFRKALKEQHNNINIDTKFIIVKDYLIQFESEIDAIYNADNIHPVINMMMDIERFIEDVVYDDINNTSYEHSYFREYGYDWHLYENRDRVKKSLMDEDLIASLEEEELTEDEVHDIFEILEEDDWYLYNQIFTDILNDEYKSRWGEWNDCIDEMYGSNYVQYYWGAKERERAYINQILFNYCDVSKINTKLKHYYERNLRDDYYGILIYCGIWDVIPED